MITLSAKNQIKVNKIYIEYDVINSKSLSHLHILLTSVILQQQNNINLSSTLILQLFLPLSQFCDINEVSTSHILATCSCTWKFHISLTSMMHQCQHKIILSSLHILYLYLYPCSMLAPILSIWRWCLYTPQIAYRVDICPGEYLPYIQIYPITNT